MKKVWAFGKKLNKTVFLWGEGELCSFLMHLVHIGAGENVMKQTLAFVAMVFEAMGRTSPTKSPLVAQVRKSAVKKRGVERSRPREVMSLGHLKVLLKNLFKKPASRADKNLKAELRVILTVWAEPRKKCVNRDILPKNCINGDILRKSA